MRILLSFLFLLYSSYAFALAQILPTPENAISEIEEYSEPVKFLIELKSPSLVELKNKDIFSAKSLLQIKNEQNITKNYLLNLKEISIIHEFQFVFNGFEISAHQHKIKELLRIPTVKRVVKSEDIFIPYIPGEEGDFDTLLNESVELVGAKALHAQNIRGEGRTIAILDTGIDSSHPAFSGPGKILDTFNAIVGGKDIKDGHGHGTHVAGISAGNGGEIVGVAPDAKLVIIKVLTDNGSGTAGNIIKGMEYVADLDQDPSTFDPVDVANLSLGSTMAGDPTDPMSQSIDRISEYGVIFAIAAGNSGYTGIASPGVAEKAITVGASTKSDAMTQFSSVGPVEKNNSLKPEIVAPGLSIKSSFLNNEYRRFSGTSMATPHVAGAVALLKQLHPEWKLREIKMALMTSAKEIQGASSFAQGWGRIQIDKAAKKEFSLSDNFIYLGTFFSSNGISEISKVLKYTNHSQDIQRVYLKSKRFIPGITLIHQNELEVPPNSNINIPIMIKVDQSALAFPDGERMFFEPNIELEINSNPINFPIYLQRGIPVNVRKGVGNLSINKLGSTFRKTYYVNSSPEVPLVLSPGKYIFTFDGYPFGFKDFYFIRNDVEINFSSSREVNLMPEEAKYKISIDHRDKLGEACKKTHNSIGIYQEWSGEKYNFIASNTIGLLSDTSIINLSNGAYKFALSSRCISGQDFSIIARAPAPVSNDEIIGTPSRMIPLKVNVAPYLKNSKFWISDMQCHFFGCLGSFVNPGSLSEYETIWFDGNEMNLRFYVVKDNRYISDSIAFYVDKNGVGHFGFLGKFYRHVPLKTLNFGLPTVTWQGVFKNRNNTLKFSNSHYFLNPFIFLDSSGYILYNYSLGDGIAYEIKRENGTIDTGRANYAIDSDNSMGYLIPTSPGRQEVTIFAPSIDGVYGLVEFFVKTNIDPEAQDPNSPLVRNLEILYNGTPSYEIGRNNITTIQFESMDEESQSPLTVRVSTKPTASPNWTNVPTSNEDSIYTSLWQPLESGLYDLKIESIDGNGNITEVNQIGGIYVN